MRRAEGVKSASRLPAVVSWHVQNTDATLPSLLSIPVLALGQDCPSCSPFVSPRQLRFAPCHLNWFCNRGYSWEECRGGGKYPESWGSMQRTLRGEGDSAVASGQKVRGSEEVGGQREHASGQGQGDHSCMHSKGRSRGWGWANAVKRLPTRQWAGAGSGGRERLGPVARSTRKARQDESTSQEG